MSFQHLCSELDIPMDIPVPQCVGKSFLSIKKIAKYKIFTHKTYFYVFLAQINVEVRELGRHESYRLFWVQQIGRWSAMSSQIIYRRASFL
jgi:hypothetical protein